MKLQLHMQKLVDGFKLLHMPFPVQQHGGLWSVSSRLRLISFLLPHLHRRRELQWDNECWKRLRKCSHRLQLHMSAKLGGFELQQL